MNKPVQCKCGGNAIIFHRNHYWIFCDKCHIETSLYGTEIEAIEAWNLIMDKRKKGKWLPHPGDEDWDVCSVCGTGCKRREHGDDGWVTEYCYRYCPNCGADLRGDHD